MWLRSACREVEKVTLKFAVGEFGVERFALTFATQISQDTRRHQRMQGHFATDGALDGVRSQPRLDVGAALGSRAMILEPKLLIA